jgi:carbonic anhydrase
VETPYLVGGPLKNDKYIFEQLHFHWADQNTKGCEHIVDGQQYSMEAHAVHYNARYKNFEEAVDKEDGLAVTGFFLQASGDVDCLDFKKISDGIQQICRPNCVAEIDPGEFDCWLNNPRKRYTFLYVQFRLFVLAGVTRADQTLLHLQWLAHHSTIP